jgi:SAM-dependent methyltransferase
MRINLADLKALQVNRKPSFRSDHASKERTSPSLWQYDYLALQALSQDAQDLLKLAREKVGGSALRVLDIGCNTSPYREQLEMLGFSVKTMDLDLSRGADLVGSVEATCLPDSCFDLVICTQVLEHCAHPWAAAPELWRILAPGGCLLVSVPHVWFYHPHPDDNWRFTPEGLTRLLRGNGFEVFDLRLQGGSILCVCQILNFCIFGLVGRFGAPIFAFLNLLGSALDSAFCNPLFPINIAVLVGKPKKS